MEDECVVTAGLLVVIDEVECEADEETLGAVELAEEEDELLVEVEVEIVDLDIELEEAAVEVFVETELDTDDDELLVAEFEVDAVAGVTLLAVDVVAAFPSPEFPPEQSH